MVEQRLEGKVALITGAGQGIGAAHARVFAQAGAKVVLADINEKAASGVAEEIVAGGGEALALYLDVGVEASWQRTVSASVARFGELTTLINNAGIYTVLGLEEETLEGWGRVVGINQTGVFLGMRTAMSALRASGNASIVNIASLLGLIGTYKCTAYHASKAAVRMLSKSTAHEYARQGVRVNSIYPGSIETPIIANMSEAEKRATDATIPLGRWGKPEEVAFASLFLCSDEAAYITGAEITVDGGYYPA